MALNVISNYAANVAHRNLMSSDAGATGSLAKLSAGQRVLSAKDDAASMAIGSRMVAEVKAMKQASVNATQASSMLQIADGAMGKISEILVRMKTLAVQAGSGQLSSTERTMLNTEYQALLSEIDRIANDTEFNSTVLLAGTTAVSTVLNSFTGATNYIQAADGVQSVVFDSNVATAAVQPGSRWSTIRPRSC
jgi:Flagellin and related hook-associated proteins